MLLRVLFFFLMCAPTAHANWKLAPVSSTNKLLAKTPGQLEPFKPNPVQLRAARGEWENFQFVVTAGNEPIRELKITRNSLATILGEFIAPQNLHIYRENYVFVPKPSGNRELQPKWWPDALIPIELAPKRIEANQSAVFWVSLFVPRDAAPGDYYGELDFLADNQPRRLALGLQVENVQMPAPTFRGTVALYYDVLRDWHTKNAAKTYTDAEWQIQKRRYYDFLLDYRINAYDLPVAWNSPAADAILKDPRVLSVRVPPLETPEFPVALAKLQGTKTLAKSFSYFIDEPAPQRFAEIRETTKKLRALGIKHLVTTHPNESLKDAVDIWCPNLGDFFGIGHLDFRALEAERKKGRETWIYTMVEPKFPYPTWLLDDSASSIRAYASIWARGGFNGFVYSMTHGWGPKPLENLESFAGTNGDGTLLYPAELVGGVGPMPSIRLMLLRDAIEEFELMKVALATKRFVRNQRFFTESPNEVVIDRDELFRAITNTVSPFAGNGLFRSYTSPQLFAAKPLQKELSLPKAARQLDGNLERSGREFDLNDERQPHSTRETASFATVGHDSNILFVGFRAQKPQTGDWFATEIAPADIENQAEKYRFVVTLKGNLVVEHLTRESQNRVEIPGFKAVVKQVENVAFVEMQIPLEPLKVGTKFRFNALRQTSAGAANTKITLRAFADAGDPFLMPLVSLR